MIFAYFQAAKAKAIAEDAQRDLDEALPALDAAVASLKNLSRNDVVEVKAMQNPPSGICQKYSSEDCKISRCFGCNTIPSLYTLICIMT
jgi:hypothetical protein